MSLSGSVVPVHLLVRWFLLLLDLDLSAHVSMVLESGSGILTPSILAHCWGVNPVGFGFFCWHVDLRGVLSKIPLMFWTAMLS